MVRVALGSGRWFEPGKADEFGDATLWDGHNRISVATGSQWSRQTLYRTKRGTWVLYETGNDRSSYEVIEDVDAFAWLVLNDHHKAAERLFPEAYAKHEM